eukprot:7387654-Prymnesium_polylepis.1
MARRHLQRGSGLGLRLRRLCRLRLQRLRRRISYERGTHNRSIGLSKGGRRPARVGRGTRCRGSKTLLGQSLRRARGCKSSAVRRTTRGAPAKPDHRANGLAPEPKEPAVETDPVTGELGNGTERIVSISAATAI